MKTLRPLIETIWITLMSSLFSQNFNACAFTKPKKKMKCKMNLNPPSASASKLMSMHQRGTLYGLLLLDCWERFTWCYCYARRDSDWGSIMVECLTIWEAIMMAIENFHLIVIESDSQVVVSAIHGKIPVPWDINLVEDFKHICHCLNEVSI